MGVRPVPIPDPTRLEQAVEPMQPQTSGRPAPARWYHLQGDDQHGPVGLADVRELVAAGRIQPDTYVWADGMPDWLPARQVPALTPPDALRRSLDAWS